MKNRLLSSAHTFLASLTRALALLILLSSLSMATGIERQPEHSVASSPIHVRHVLGFENVARNVSGELSITSGDLCFRRDGHPATQVSLSSIHKVSVAEQDKQVGGVPLMLGKAAVPYSGGRVISLFSHKRYDTLAIEYVDSAGGFHGAVFRMPRGQASIFSDALIARGAHINEAETPSSVQSISVESPEGKEWSVQVNRVDPGTTALDASFSNAIYENLMRELSKSKQFKDVFRSGDRDANTVSELLVLKTLVEKYSPGSETRRAVTTITGATKVKVQIQLATPNGQVVLERTVEGDVRFIGDNLAATNKIAKKTAKILKRSTLPAPAALVAQQGDSRKETVNP